MFSAGPGFYPTVMHQYQMHEEDPSQWGMDLPSSVVYGAEVMAKIKGSRPRRKYNLMAQVIPIYGFGIFLYIFYIIYKVTNIENTDMEKYYIYEIFSLIDAQSMYHINTVNDTCY